MVYTPQLGLQRLTPCITCSLKTKLIDEEDCRDLTSGLDRVLLWSGDGPPSRLSYNSQQPIGLGRLFAELLISEALSLFVQHPSPRREVTPLLQGAGLKALHASRCQGPSSGVWPANTFIFAFMLCFLCRPDKRLKCHKTIQRKQQLL